MKNGTAPSSIRNLEKEKFLGYGAFGQVWKCSWPGKTDVGPLAVKEIDLTRIRQLRLQSQLRREVSLMRSIQHPYIVQHHFDFCEDNFMYIGMAFAEQGNLYQKLDALVKSKRMDLTAQWFWEICDALEYLHGSKIVHRDIKPENILLDRSNHALLADFGWSNIMAEVDEREAKEQETTLKTFCGTAEYLAPEMVARSGHDEGLDMWMMGVLLYEMIAGFTPYASSTGSNKEIEDKIKKGSVYFPPDMNADAKDLVVKLLRPVSAERLRANQAKDHTFIVRNFGGRPTIVVGGEEGTQDGRPSVLRRLDEVREKLQGEMLYMMQEKSKVEQELFQVNQDLEDTYDKIRKFDLKMEAADKEMLNLCDVNTELEGGIQDAQERLAALREEIAMRKRS
eukprot:TRINITY_DN13102_c0_g3_i1.p1 TRINITY_DN13102_c0_g3~~TRINITY_DN13102_c0_g3_i1.p1  ORF type:complete len:395 (+),score=97.00 TRINITY_DN13102_c0_g3_i1:111-1295(+)